VSDVYAEGGEGGLELAERVVEAAAKPGRYEFLYPLESTIKEKIETIATSMYGAEGVDYEPKAEKDIAWLTEWGFDRLPVCMAKTQMSLSHDPRLRGAPKGFRVPIQTVRASVGAGFLVPICGEMNLMPGLPSVPGATRIDVDAEGNIVGLF
ncbi:MAG: formate--tetrahydrofolate ligase, partial [FCB group bacterium]|jgi:formyltetrahydrofolate synthetase|nr:formate--tetrahydrofolate ligase [FCB group bacterium]